MTSAIQPKSRIPGLAAPLAGAALAAVLIGLIPPSAHAQSDGATVGMFLKETASRPCDITLPSCEDPKLKLGGETDVPYYVFLCVFNGDPVKGVAGMSFGISYPSSQVSIQTWSSCSDLEFAESSWPGSGTSNVLTWSPQTNCQKNVPSGSQGVVTLGGYFYLTAYGDAQVKVIPKRQTGTLDVADCDAHQYKTREGGSVAFSHDGSASGGLPCRKTEQTTWSRIKETTGGSN